MQYIRGNLIHPLKNHDMWIQSSSQCCSWPWTVLLNSETWSVLPLCVYWDWPPILFLFSNSFTEKEEFIEISSHSRCTLIHSFEQSNSQAGSVFQNRVVEAMVTFLVSHIWCKKTFKNIFRYLKILFWNPWLKEKEISNHRKKPSVCA